MEPLIFVTSLVLLLEGDVVLCRIIEQSAPMSCSSSYRPLSTPSRYINPMVKPIVTCIQPTYPSMPCGNFDSCDNSDDWKSLFCCLLSLALTDTCQEGRNCFGCNGCSNNNYGNNCQSSYNNGCGCDFCCGNMEFSRGCEICGGCGACCNCNGSYGGCGNNSGYGNCGACGNCGVCNKCGRCGRCGNQSCGSGNSNNNNGNIIIYVPYPIPIYSSEANNNPSQNNVNTFNDDADPPYLISEVGLSSDYYIAPYGPPKSY